LVALIHVILFVVIAAAAAAAATFNSRIVAGTLRILKDYARSLNIVEDCK